MPALDSDPSYVFFRVAPDQTASNGPLGALGVPLTPGRSIAVDPRTTPMGYPVYLSAPTPPGSTIALQRLVMAQDTGGAIRGAMRADFFWGFGSSAGRQAMRTRERGQMWLMLPRSEAERLQSGGLVTRGSRASARRERLGRVPGRRRSVLLRARLSRAARRREGEPGRCRQRLNQWSTKPPRSAWVESTVAISSPAFGLPLSALRISAV